MTVLEQAQPRTPPATTVPARPMGPVWQYRRRTSGIRRTDVFAVLGALLAGFTTSGVLFAELGPFTGILGYVVATWLLTVAYYALLVSFDENRVAVKDRIASFVMHSLGALLVLALIVVVVYTFVGRGGWRSLGYLNFYAQDLRSAQATDPLSKGGILHAILGTLIELGIALGIAVPLGFLAAVYLHEVPGRLTRFIRTVVDAMTALPDIIAGLFIYATLILIFHLGPSGFAAASALAVTILPIIIRASEVVLRLVPGSLKEASYALGASQWRTTWHVLLPTARSGLATAVILGAARAIGETSPVLLTAGATGYTNLNPFKGAMMSLPLFVFTEVQSSENNEVARGFGAGAVLLALVVVLFTVARVIGGRAPGDLSAGQRRRRLAASQRDAQRFTPAPMPGPYASAPTYRPPGPFAGYRPGPPLAGPPPGYPLGPRPVPPYAFPPGAPSGPPSGYPPGPPHGLPPGPPPGPPGGYQAGPTWTPPGAPLPGARRTPPGAPPPSGTAPSGPAWTPPGGPPEPPVPGTQEVN